MTDYAVDLSQATKDDIQKGVDANTTVTNKGLTFTGTTGSTTAKKLGESVEISGDDNITTEATADKVQIKLKKDITVDSVTAGDTKIDKNGLKAGDVTVTNAPITVMVHQLITLMRRLIKLRNKHLVRLLLQVILETM